LRIRLFDNDYLLAFHNLGFHPLLLIRLQRSFALCLGAHALYGVHHVALLREKRIT